MRCRYRDEINNFEMYFSITALAAVCFVVLVKAEGENNDSMDQDNPAKKENKENQYTELSDFYTFVALIDIVFKDHTKRTCSGAIIHDNVVITAAHCFLGKDRYVSSKPELTASFVVIGTKTMFETGYEQYLPIERFITHPMFEGWTADLALVYTFAGMTSDKPGTIIPLAGDMSAHVDSNVTVYSWGEASSNEDTSYEPRPKKKHKKTTTYDSCSEEDQDDSSDHTHRKIKGSQKRFRNSNGEDYNEDTKATKLEFYGKRFRNLRGGEDRSNEEEIKKVDSSVEQIGLKRTAMFYGKRLWSIPGDTTPTTLDDTLDPKFGKTNPIRQRADEDEEEIESKFKYKSKKSTKIMTKETTNSDDYNYDLMKKINNRDKRHQSTKWKSRYLADIESVTENVNISIKPYKFGESVDFSDSFEKQLLKKHVTSSKTTRRFFNKHPLSGEIEIKSTKERHFSGTKKHSTKERRLPKHPSTFFEKTKKKKSKTTASTTEAEQLFENENKQPSYRSHGWRRSLGSQHNQLFVGSFGYVNIQGCRALVEKAMPPKYEISKGNDAICYTSTKRCIGENDSGAPAVRQGRLIAITVGGAQCEGDNVAVGMKMNCYCAWISDNLPHGSHKFNCCKNCCDMKHKEVKDDNNLKEKANKNKYRS